MRSRTKIAILFILFYSLQIHSYGQIITFGILKKMITSTGYKDSIVKAFKLTNGGGIPAAAFGTGFEWYRSLDSSIVIVVVYKDSATGCTLFTNDLNLLHNILSAGKVNGFAKTTLVRPPNSKPFPNTKTTFYVKGNYLLTFNDVAQDKKKSKVSMLGTSNVSLAKNYQVFNVSTKSN